MKTDRRENVKVIVTNCKDRYIVNYNYLSEYNYLSVFFWTSVISKVFVATLSMCLFVCYTFLSKQILTPT